MSLSKCNGVGYIDDHEFYCQKKDDCYRYSSNPSEPWRNLPDLDFTPMTGCSFFIENKI